MTGRGGEMGGAFTRHEMNLIRQWFNAVEDTDRAYLVEEDYDLADKVCDLLGVTRTKRKLAAPRDGAREAGS